MYENKISISRKSLLLFCAFCMWIVPTYLYDVSFFMTFSSLFGYLAIPVFLFDMCILHRKNPPSGVFWMIVLSIVVQGYSTAISNPELLLMYIKQYSKTIAFCYFLDKFTKEKGATRTINVLLHYLEIMIFINFLTLLIFPNGMYTSGSYSRNFWMGYDNTHIRWQIPALSLSYIYSFIVKKSIDWRNIILTTIVLISCFLIKAGTATIAVIIFILGMIYILLGKRKDWEKGIKFFSPIVAAILSVIGTVVVVGGTVAGTQIEIVQNISRFFGKDSATLTGRSYIWIRTIDFIKKNFWFGTGYETADMTSMRLVNKVGYGTSPHNLCLEILYCGGIVLAVVIAIIYIYLHFKTRKINYIPAISVCGLWLAIVSIMGLTEPQYSSQLRIAWIIIGNMPFICMENKLVNKKKEIMFLNKAKKGEIYE